MNWIRGDKLCYRNKALVLNAFRYYGASISDDQMLAMYSDAGVECPCQP